MHKLGWMVKMGAVPIHDYVAANYCPTLGEDQGWCEEALSRYYVGMLFAIVEHYFVDGAIHVCQTGGACDAVKEDTSTRTLASSLWLSTSPPCTRWPWRSSSSPPRSACTSLSAEPPDPLSCKFLMMKDTKM